MSEPCRVSFRDGRLASRKAEEAGTFVSFAFSLSFGGFCCNLGLIDNCSEKHQEMIDIGFAEI